MARRPRLQFENATYHVMARGNRKGVVYHDDADRRAWLDVLAVASKRYAVRCQAYCLMSNHYHLVLHTPEANLSEAMRQLNGVYTQRYNRRYATTGHVFEGRFTSILVDNADYMRAAVRYVARNPVKAELVVEPAGWAWSSYRATAGLSAVPEFLSIDWIDWVFGGSRSTAQARFRRFVDAARNPADVDDESALLSGSVEFEREVRDRLLLAGALTASTPRIHRALGRPPLDELFRDRPTKGAELDERVQRAHEKYGYRLSEIARFLRVHPTTVSFAIRRYERRSGSGHETSQT